MVVLKYGLQYFGISRIRRVYHNAFRQVSVQSRRQMVQDEMPIEEFQDGRQGSHLGYSELNNDSNNYTESPFSPDAPHKVSDQSMYLAILPPTKIKPQSDIW